MRLTESLDVASAQQLAFVLKRHAELGGDVLEGVELRFIGVWYRVAG